MTNSAVFLAMLAVVYLTTLLTITWQFYTKVHSGIKMKISGQNKNPGSVCMLHGQIRAPDTTKVKLWVKTKMIVGLDSTEFI